MMGIDDVGVGPILPDKFSGSRCFSPPVPARPAVGQEGVGLPGRHESQKRRRLPRRAVAALCCGVCVLGLACAGGYVWMDSKPPVMIGAGGISGGGSLAGSSTYANYAKAEDVPKKYRKYIWLPDGLPADFGLDIINVVDSTSYITAKSCYSSPTGGWLCIERTMHRSTTGITTYGDKDAEEDLVTLDPIYVDGVELRRYHGVDDGREAFLIRFFYGESRYVIDSNLPLEAVEGLAKECLAAAMAE